MPENEIEIKENEAPEIEYEKEGDAQIKILEAGSVMQLAETIEPLVRKGWVMYGAMTSVYDNQRNSVFYQMVMTKRYNPVDQSLLEMFTSVMDKEEE